VQRRRSLAFFLITLHNVRGSDRKVFKVTKLNPGDVYELKVGSDPEVSIQVGRGGDCGIFVGKCDARTFQGSPSFRVLVNEKDLRKYWKKVGNYELGNDLQHYAYYGDADIGSDVRYRVTLQDLDARVPIQDAEFQNLERLSVWETAHILARIAKAKKWF